MCVLTLLTSLMEKYFITDRHFSRSRRFITLAVFHFQIGMSRNYPISLFIITSNTFSVQFHTAPWFIAFARLIKICWYYKRLVSLNPMKPRRQAYRTTQGLNLSDSHTHSRKQFIYTLFTRVFLSCPTLPHILRKCADSWRQQQSLRNLD